MNILKLQCGELIKPVAAASRACGKGTMPIAEHILLDVKDDVLNIVAYNFHSTWIQVSLPIVSGDHWQSAPNAKKLLSVLKALPSDSELTLVQDSDTLTVRSGKSRFKLMSLNPDDMPDELPTHGQHISFEVDAHKLSQRLSSVSFAAAKDDVRYYLNGVCLEAENGQVKAIATNGHRLAHSQWLSVDAELPKSVIIATDSVTEILSALNQYPNHTATVTLSDYHVTLDIANIRMINGLVDGRFPEWKRTIDNNPDRELVKVDRQALLNALNRVAILSSQHRGVQMVFTHELTLSTANDESEEGLETVEIDRSQEVEKKISLNVQLLIEALRSMGDEVVTLSLPPEPTMTFQITAETSDSDSYHVISPIRL